MVADTTPGPGTATIVRQIHDRAAAILLQHNGNQFSFTVAGFGFSSSFYIPLVAVWAHHPPEFFQGLTVATTFRRGEILSASSIPPHGGPPATAYSSSPSGHIAPAGPPPPHIAPSVTYRPSVSQAIHSDGRYPSLEKAFRLLFGATDDSVTHRKRELLYSQVSAPYFNRPTVPLCHGSNISVDISEERGSVGVFLSPEDNPRICHLLTAGHVLGATPPVGTTFQTASSLDVLRELARALRHGVNPEEQDEGCAAVFSRLQESVAILVAESIGVDANGWQEDWAVARVAHGFVGNNAFVGGNGDWDDGGILSDDLQIFLETDTPVDRGMILGHAEVGDTVLKIGASTGTTRGIINGTHVFTYYQRTVSPTLNATAVISDTHKDLMIERATFAVIFPENTPRWQPYFCEPGDCGSGVFKFVGGRCTWVGLLVGAYCEDGGLRDIGLMVPQQAVLAQLRKKTGKRWQLF